MPHLLFPSAFAVSLLPFHSLNSSDKYFRCMNEKNLKALSNCGFSLIDYNNNNNNNNNNNINNNKSRDNRKVS